MSTTRIRFLIIGAAKSATTWLQRSLQSDPDVVMPDPELHYFSREFHRGEDWYLAQFPQTSREKVVGEKSNSYLDYPDAAARVHAVLPHAKLIAQLRNPVERAYSDYCMLYRRGEVGRDIAQYLDPRVASTGRFLVGGLYFRQLEAYLNRFPSDQLLIQFYEDVRQDPVAQLALVRAFLELRSDAVIVPVGRKVKDKTTPVLGPNLRRYLRPLKPLVAPIRGTSYFRFVHAMMAKETQYSALTTELRQRIVDFYEPETEKLGKLVGRDLSQWLRERASPSSNTRVGAEHAQKGAA
jgi:hypothetical protein